MKKIKNDCMLAFGVKKKRKNKRDNSKVVYSKENTLRDLDQLMQ